MSTSAFTQDGASSVFADLGREESETRASTEKGTKGNLWGDEKLKVSCCGTGTCGKILYYLRPLCNMGYCKVLLMLDIFNDEKEIFEIYFFNFSEEIKSK